MSAPRDFAQDVQEAIDSIPHAESCRWLQRRVGGYLKRADGVLERPPCNCDRQQRVAQQVAAAIDVVVASGPDLGWGRDPYRAALAVLRGGERPEL